MTGRRLGGADGDASRFSEDRLDRRKLTAITNGRGSRMRIQMLDVFRSETGLAQCHRHGTRSTFTILGARGHVIGIGGRAISHHLRDRHGASSARMFEIFDEDNACPLAHDEAVAITIEGS